MSEPTAWYRSLEIEVASAQAKIGAADSKDYHLDRLLKIARRVNEFEPDCPKCRILQPGIYRMLRDLAANAPQILPEQKRQFLGGMETVYTHLKKTHGFISERQNIGLWLALGTAFGVILGAILQNPVIGIPIGAAVGLAVGYALDMRAKKAGKVI